LEVVALRFMASKISTELEILMKNLEAINAPVLKLLNPPIDEGKLIGFFDGYFPGIPISEDIKDIFLWHDGTTVENNVPVRKSYLFEGFYLNSMLEMQTIMETNERFYKLKEHGFLPLFSTGHGEYLALNLKDYSINPEKTPLYYLSTWNPEFELYTSMYDSFYQMLNTVNECFKQNGCFINTEDFMLDYDSKIYNRISKGMNPNSEYWKL
jgi:hypothetical protein